MQSRRARGWWMGMGDDETDEHDVVDADFRVLAEDDPLPYVPDVEVDADEEWEDEEPEPEPVIITLPLPRDWNPPRWQGKRASDYLQESADILRAIEQRADAPASRRPSWRDRLWRARKGEEE